MTTASTGAQPLTERRAAPVIGLLTSVGETLDAFFVEIARRWRESGAVVEPAAGTPSAEHPSATVLTAVTRSPSPRNHRAMRELREWVREKRIEIVVTNTATASALVRLADVGVPVVYFCHGLHWNGRRAADLPFRSVERLLLHRTDAVVCMNSADEAWFAAHAPQTPRLRLLAGVGLDLTTYPRRPRRAWDEGAEPLRLVWCGEYSERKNPAAMVELAHVLRDRGVDLRVDMLGDGALIGTDAVTSPVDGLVRHRGRSDVVPWFDRSHVLVQTSRWEGLPRVGLEAIAMGLPAVGFDVKGVRDLPAVSVAPEGDADVLADVVLAVARGRGAELPPPSSLSSEHAADELLDFLDSVLSGDYRRGRIYAA